MTDSNDQDQKKVLHLSGSGKGKLELKKPVDKPVDNTVRQSFSHGRTKTVTVEVKRKRAVEKGAVPGVADGGAAARQAAQGIPVRSGQGGRPARGSGGAVRQLTKEEREARLRALRGAVEEEAQRREAEAEAAEAAVVAAEAAVVEAENAPAPAEASEPEVLDAETLRKRELEEMRLIQEEEGRIKAAAEERRRQEEDAKRRDEEARKAEETRKKADDQPRARSGAGPASARTPAADTAVSQVSPAPRAADEEEDAGARGGAGRGKPSIKGKAAPAAAPRKAPGAGAPAGDRRRGSGKLTVSQALHQSCAAACASAAGQCLR